MTRREYVWELFRLFGEPIEPNEYTEKLAKQVEKLLTQYKKKASVPKLSTGAIRDWVKDHI